jgi:hypothetical protein
MQKTFASPFIDKYARPYKMLYKLHPNVYILLLPTTFVAHSTFHVSNFMKTRKRKRKNMPIIRNLTSLNIRLWVKLNVFRCKTN